MAGRSRRPVLLLFVAGMLAALALVPPASAGAAPPFVPIEREHIALPDGFQASTPIWTTDGNHLLFSNAGDLWLIAEDGSGLRCLTCGLPNAPHFAPQAQEAFKDVFPDGKRVLFGDFSKAFVLECAPSVLQCDQAQLLPIDVAEGSPGIPPDLGGGVWHLAPDGEHLGWTTTRLDTRPMLIGKLVRREADYTATQVRTINPPTPTLGDTDPRHWTNAAGLYELKGFSADGRFASYVTNEYEGNPDVYQVNLATGETDRLTGNPDWDEDNGQAPDGKTWMLHSDRGMHRVEAAGLLPRRAFINYPVSINAAIYYVGTTTGFQCDLQPWLLPASGDEAGKLVGQPLDPYDDSRLHAQNNVPGRGAWSPDSTKVALTEMSYDTGLGPSRLLIAKLDRPPAPRVEIHPSDVGAWAKTPANWQGTIGTTQIVTVPGLSSGSATITYLGTLAALGHWSVTYNHYSDDGRSFVDGTETLDSPLGFLIAPAHYFMDLKVAGAHNGYLKGDLTIGRFAAQTPFASGNLETEVDGYKIAGGAQKLGPCPQLLPRVQPVQLSTGVRKMRVKRGKPGKRGKRGKRRSQKGWASVLVKADAAPKIWNGSGFGDTRPIEGATVTIGGQKTRTGADGVATVVLPLGKKAKSYPVAVAAGDTFAPASATVRMPKAKRAKAKRRRGRHSGRRGRRRGL